MLVSMRIAIAATLMMAAGLVAANMLGVAAAEAPTSSTSAVRTLSVEGVANVPIPQTANVATADAVYRQGMADAVTDGQGKAEFLASKTGVTLGSVQSVVEDGGSISCQGTEGEGEELRYVQYEGEQPDFGSGPSVSVGGVAAPAAAATPTLKRAATGKHRKKHKRASAKAATNASCTLSAQVSLVYQLD
jgi:hypothetical protein